MAEVRNIFRERGICIKIQRNYQMPRKEMLIATEKKTSMQISRLHQENCILIFSLCPTSSDF